MATDNMHLEVSRLSGGDLTGQLYRAVKLDSSARAIVVTAQGEAGLGVLYGEEASAGKPVAVATMGVVKARAGATLTPGQILTVQADGDFEPSLTGDREWGIALEAAAAGDIFKMQLGLSQNITA